jgi:hypothetical protein
MLSRAGFRVLQALTSVPDDQHAAQKNAPKSSEKLMEVHCGGSQHGIDRIADDTLQPIAFQPVFALPMSDAWFDRSAPFHPSPWRSRNPAASPLIDMHGDRTVIAVASIPHVHVRFTGLVVRQSSQCATSASRH